MKRALLALLALPLAAQTVPAGLVYQQASQLGVEYLIPPVGISILNQKANSNWKSLVNGAAGSGTLYAVVAGVTKVIAISQPWIEGIALFHGAWDSWGSGVLQSAAPDPSPITSLVLPMNGSLTVTPGTCAEGAIFASGITTNVAGVRKHLTVKNLRSASSSTPTAPPMTTFINGTTVTLTPQGAIVLKNAAGAAINQFMVIDVLACPSVTPVMGEAPGGNISGLAVNLTSIDTSRVKKIMEAHEAGERAALEQVSFESSEWPQIHLVVR